MFIWTNETSRIPQCLFCACSIHTIVLICCFIIQFHIFTLIRREFWLNETVGIKVSDDCEMDDDDDLDGLGRCKQTWSSKMCCLVWGHNHHDGMWQDSLIWGHQSEMNDDGGRDDWYKQEWWSGVSHINACEGIIVKIPKKVRERDEEGWEGRRKLREGGELGEDSIW